MKKLARVMAAAVAVVFALSLVPCAFAADDAYDVWVSGVQVTEENAADVLGDGTVSFVVGESEDEGTLTLTDAHLEYANAAEGGYAYGIDTGLNLTIVFDGVTTISGGSCESTTTAGVNVRSADSLHITGTGVADIALPAMPMPDGSDCIAIQADAENLLIDGDTYVLFDTESAYYDEDVHSSLNEWFVKCTGSATIENELIEMNLCAGDRLQYGVDAAKGISIGGAVVFKARLSLAYESDARAIVFRVQDPEAACVLSDNATIQVDAPRATHCVEASRFIAKGNADIYFDCYFATTPVIAADDIQLCDAAVLSILGHEPFSTMPDLSSHVSGTARVGQSAKDAVSWDGLTPIYGPDAAYCYVSIPDAPVLTRVSGEYASDTAAAISQITFQMGTRNYASVVITRDDDYADALSAAALAGTCYCPIILTSRDGVSPAAAKEIARLKPYYAFVIGGEGAISTQVDDDLRELGVESVRRVWGENSFDTSLACAEQVTGKATHKPMIVASPMGFADALSIAPVSYRYESPIILQTFGETSDNRGFTDEAKAYIHWHGGHFSVMGGEGAVSTSSLEGFDIDKRIWGETAYDTSAAIAEYAVKECGMYPTTLVVACGADASKGLDALAGASLAGRSFAPLVLINDNSELGAVNNRALNSFMDKHEGEIQRVYILGGTYVMPDSVAERTLVQLGSAVDHT